MSTCTHESMTNHHAPFGLSAVVEAVQVWRNRINERRELAHWTERDIRDAGLSVGEVIAEVDKPFWQA